MRGASHSLLAGGGAARRGPFGPRGSDLLGAAQFAPEVGERFDVWHLVRPVRFPQALERNWNAATGSEAAAGSIALSNLLDLDMGYSAGHPGWDEDTRTPTRLVGPSI